MALTIIDPGMFGPISNYWTEVNGRNWDGSTASLYDSADAAPVFDTAHAVYTSSVVDEAR